MKRNALLSVAIAAAVLAASPNAVLAADKESAADRTTRALAVADRTQDGEADVKVAGEATVKLSSTIPSASLTIKNQTVRLAVAGSTATESEVRGPTRIFGNGARDTDFAVRPATKGAQILAVMHSPSAPATQSYQVSLPDGVRLDRIGQGFGLIERGKLVGTIAAPWARDAAGRSLPTSYTVNGSTLVQHTDTTGAKYPVVADPKITFGRGVYLNMWGSEVRVYATLIIAVFGSGYAVSCTLIGRLPNQALRSLATLLCGAAAVNLRQVFQVVVDLWRKPGLSDGACYQVKVYPRVNPAVVVNGRNCR